MYKYLENGKIYFQPGSEIEYSVIIRKEDVDWLKEKVDELLTMGRLSSDFITLKLNLANVRLYRVYGSDGMLSGTISVCLENLEHHIQIENFMQDVMGISQEKIDTVPLRSWRKHDN